MTWTGIVPLKQGADRKSRLSDRLSAEGRAALSDRMAAHVIACLKNCPLIGRIILLSPQPWPCQDVEWRQDSGQGLNRELERLRTALGSPPLLVIHADLPLLTRADVEALLEAAQGGIALAPDWHGMGTNALAIEDDRPFTFVFGADSFARHKAGADVTAIVSRPGLALDVDTPEDLEMARNTDRNSE